MLCEYLKVKPELLKFMLKVFKDLEFIYDDQGIIKINSQPSKQYRIKSYLSIETVTNGVEKRLYDDFSNKEWIKSQLS